MSNDFEIGKAEADLLFTISQEIELAKSNAARVVNSYITLLYWDVGRRIDEHILRKQRAKYGKQILVTLSRELATRFGKSFEEKNLRRMLQFSRAFSDRKKVATLSRQLTWSHFLVLLPIRKLDELDFYVQHTLDNSLSVRALRNAIGRETYKRSQTANLQLPDETHPMINNLRDPYVLDFLNLRKGYSESDLEAAIVTDLEKFILEFGNGFSFLARQKKMIIDNQEFYLDLLFYQRKIRRLVAIELKVGKFHASFKGQMELYLKWLNRNERQVDEDYPIGIILCTETSPEQIELLEMHKDGIFVSEYWTDLPPREELKKRINESFQSALERFNYTKSMQAMIDNDQ